jgi:hypothetical protein
MVVVAELGDEREGQIEAVAQSKEHHGGPCERRREARLSVAAHASRSNRARRRAGI